MNTNSIKLKPNKNYLSWMIRFFIIILIFLNTFISAQEENTLNSIWKSNEPGTCSIVLKLYSDKSWSAECCGPGSCLEGEGNYEDKTQTISFTVKKSVKTNPEKKDDFYFKLFKANCKWIEDKTRLDFSELLICGKNTLLKDSSKVVEGMEIESKHGLLIALGQKNGKTKDDAKFRNAPSLTSRTNKCKIETFIDQYGSEGIIPKNTPIQLLGKTKEKVKIKNWENVWYFIQTLTSAGNKNCKENTGWVFGEFVNEE